jgi:sugar/nucleoside kinase (ribokinase family)
MIAPSTVLLIRDDFSFPQPNGYAEIARTLPSIGGEAANSAIVLARLGLTTRLDGCWVNRRSAERVLATLAGYGIDVSRVTTTDTESTDEVVIADGESRTVFGNYAGFHDGPRQWNEPSPEDVFDARIVCLDPWFRPDAARAARLCVEYDKPYVTLDSPYDDYIAQNAAAIVISHELRDQAYADRDPARIFDEYLAACGGLVVFTFGGGELWYGRRGGERVTASPYEIEPLDTTGAGDSFRGAIAYGLLMGWPDERVVDFASAVAACVCMTMPHALNAPDLAEVEAFIEERKAGR